LKSRAVGLNLRPGLAAQTKPRHGRIAMTPEKQKFVDDLINTFASDMIFGTLLARLQWYLFDDETLAFLRAWAIREAGYDAALTQVDIAAGMIGIAGTGHSGRADFVKGFVQTVFSLAQSRGDPPFAPAFRDRALDAALGRLDAMQGLQLLASAQPQISLFLNTFGGFQFAAPTIAAFLQPMVRSMGVLAMPRRQLYELYLSLSPDNAAQAAALVSTEMFVRTYGDLAGAQNFLTGALRITAQTRPQPRPEDVLQVINKLVTFWESR
jgi:hypothetical protein